MSEVACGCQANIHYDIHYTPTDIEFCPKHAAADAMYGELLELIDICPGCQGMGYTIDWDATEPTKYNCLDCDGARNVIALADGNGGE